MKIVTFSVAPIFKDYIHGGSQRIFMDIANYMTSKGHSFDVYCTKRGDNNESFEINKNFRVNPVFNFKETFPMPYQTAPYNLRQIIDQMNDSIKDSDLLYLHANGSYFQKLLKKATPTISSLHDFIYEISMVSAFMGESDRTIVPSEYLRDCIVGMIGDLYENYSDRVQVIRNGINLNSFKPNNRLRKELREKYGINDDEKVIFFPHRPDESKGITTTLHLIDFLHNGVKIKTKLVIPKHIDLRVSQESNIFYDYIEKYSKNHGFYESLLFYDWTPTKDVPAYYNMADLTLCIGNFVESFGLTPLESICSGTPIIASKAGAFRRIVPDTINIPKIDFDDFEMLKRHTIQLLKDDARDHFDFKQIREVVAKEYPFDGMLKAYEKMFTNTKVTESLKISRKKKPITGYTLAPWCYISDRGLYNDYMGHFVKIPKNLVGLLKSGIIPADNPTLSKNIDNLLKLNAIVKIF